MTTTIDYDTALELLQRAVAEKGADYVYPEELYVAGGCAYRKDGTPACIVGYVLDYAGIEIPDELNSAAIDNVRFSPLLTDVTRDARELLKRAQDEQDGGRPWGEAVRIAVEMTS